MTTPDERYRNRTWAREALDELAQDVQLPNHWKQQAQDLLDRWPRGEFLSTDGIGPAGPGQSDGVDVILGAQTLFQGVRASASCTEERRYSLLVILRHLI